MTLTRIRGGTVHDPANNRDGVVMDLWFRDGLMVEGPGPGESPSRTYDASGLVVMPGGVDMHCHIAGPKVNLARKMRPEDHRDAAPVRRTPITRSGTAGSVPSTFATGYLYAGLGYTTAVDAAIPPLAARHTHEEFHDTPILDKAFLILMGNNYYALKAISEGEYERARAFAGWLLESSRAYGIKVVNPGGVEAWKSGWNNIHSLDEEVPHLPVTPRMILRGLAQASMDLGLPHPVHIHCNNLGLPGNAATTIGTMEALEGRRAHLAHIQFHSYGGEVSDQASFRSDVPRLAEWINSHPEVSVDVGQVLFGSTTSMTGDGPLGYFLHQVTGRKWTSADTEMEAGCGIVPIVYKEKSFVHALQWAIGLEWYLLVKDPWRVGMSTDHPNGASFVAYPELVALLMDRGYRRDVLNRVHPRVRERSILQDLDREYTLQEIAIISRAGPARLLGLSTKGHLGVGADADITIYNSDRDRRRMFELPRMVFKAGELVVDRGEIRAESRGLTWHVRPGYDDGVLPDIRRWFESYYTIRFRNYPVDDSCLSGGGAVSPCDGGKRNP
ncbi:MAG: formylmethanofuran dehydrogenase subunit A [Planctomycetes bacterium]|nr:formylmethanofuran dehydrogenase subunit A [Planctomycetota bacterium]